LSPINTRALARNLRRWPVVVGLTAIVIVAVGGGAWAMSRSSGSTSGSDQLVAAAVQKFTSTVSASGTIEPAHTASLDFATSGRVTRVAVSVGDKVHKGQRLATVGTAALAASKDAAESQLTAAQDKVSADDSSTSSAQLSADEAALRAARSQLSSAAAALRDATLRSTIAGTVTTVDLTVGQQVTGGSDTSGGANQSSSSDTSSGSTSQVVVQSSSTFIINGTVDDTQIDQVHKGQSVTITPSGATQAVSGTVTSVGTVPSSSSGTVTFPIVVKVSGHPSGLYAGASATMSITTKKAVRALVVPTLAVRYEGSRATVEVDDGGSRSTRAIQVGTTYGFETQVLSGLRAGEKVVVSVPTFGRPSTSRGSGEGGSGGGTFPGGGSFPGGFSGSGGGSFPSGGSFPGGLSGAGG
jgi:multidrug efflux pump subunit AcrA (membrane-fusion protein)